MIKHLVMWRLDDALSPQEKQLAAQRMKRDILALREQIPGIITMDVQLSDQDTSSHDVLLNADFATPQALAAYQVNSLHQAVAQYVATITTHRACIDYTIE